MAGRTGILGGTFDPIHVGHLEAAAAARDAFRLDRVLLMAARTPPHRAARPVASAFHRFAMVALAAMERDGFLVSDLELGEPGPSYTSATLRRLAKGDPASQFFFICGADAFAEIATWHDYPDLLDRAHFVVVSRPGHRAAALRDRLPDLAGRMRGAGAELPSRPEDRAILLLDAATTDTSSTDIRRRVADGLPTAGLVPPTIARYIDRHGLYGRQGPCNDD